MAAYDEVPEGEQRELVEALESLVRRGFVECIVNLDDPENPVLVPTPKGTAAVFGVDYPDEDGR